MGAVANLLVLACATNAVLAWNIPQIPANRRAEYYLQHDDGAYKFGYDTGTGISHSAIADPTNEVRGSYAYQSPEGPVQLIYTAGRGGFVPNPESVGTKSSIAAPVVAVQSRPTTYTAPVEEYDENADASYNFNFDTNEYKRDESSDAKGNVRGRYSYNSKEGNRVAVAYKAGAGTGFVIESQEGLDVPSTPTQYSSPSKPSTPTQYSSPVAPAPKPYSGPLANTVASGPLQDGSYSFSYQSNDHDRQESGDSTGVVRGRYSFVADDGVRRTVDYHAGAETGYVPTGDGIVPAEAPVAPAVQAYTARPAIVAPVAQSYNAGPAPVASVYEAQNDDTPGDASYSFAFEADDHARQESSDQSGNVQGEYSFTAPDGQNRKIKYTAGADKGFVVESSEESQGTKPVVSTYSAPKPQPSYQAPAHSFASQHAAMTKQVTESLGSVGNTDGSYSFAYKTDDHSHNANADRANNVRGSFSFVADDGVSRQVDYEAGSATGFIAKGAHLPVAPVAPVVPVVSTYNVQPAAPAYIPPAPKTPSYVAPAVKTAPVVQTVSNAPVDASYSFSYDAGDSQRQENADASGFVRGQFSFVADDGVSRSVQYEAGANKGFVAQGAHLPTVPESTGVTVATKQASVANTKQTGYVASSYSAAKEEKGDASYSYNYQTDTSSKSESSDSQGNVKGTFTFVGGDGLARTLNYVAGPESGFQASGAHLPVAPVAPVAPAAQSPVVAAKSAYIWTAPAVTSWTAPAAPKASSTGSSWTQTSSWSAPAAKFVLHKYLPPESSQKFGYVFDTQ